MRYLTSDLHFNHKNVIKYNNRPFENIDEMNSTLIDNWNSVVRNKDTVYCLGDFAFGDPIPIVKKLNGKIFFLIGDHDHSILKHKDQLLSMGHKGFVDFLRIKEAKQEISLFHWCIRTWPKSHYGSYHAFGHSHGKLEPIGKSWDVGVDNNNYKPLSIYEFFDIMNNRPDNPNLVKKTIGLF